MRYLGYGIGHKDQTKPAVSKSTHLDKSPPAPASANSFTRRNHPQAQRPNPLNARHVGAMVNAQNANDSNEDSSQDSDESEEDSDVEDEDDMDECL